MYTYIYKHTLKYTSTIDISAWSYKLLCEWIWYPKTDATNCLLSQVPSFDQSSRLPKTLLSSWTHVGHMVHFSSLNYHFYPFFLDGYLLPGFLGLDLPTGRCAEQPKTNSCSLDNLPSGCGQHFAMEHGHFLEQYIKHHRTKWAVASTSHSVSLPEDKTVIRSALTMPRRSFL